MEVDFLLDDFDPLTRELSVCTLERSSRWLENSMLGECEYEKEDKWQKVVGLLVETCAGLRACWIQ